MGCTVTSTIDTSEWHYISNIREGYQCQNNINHIGQNFRHNDKCSSVNYIPEILSYHALHGWYNVDPRSFVILLSATNKHQSIHIAALFCRKPCQCKPIVNRTSYSVHHLRDFTICLIYSNIKVVSLWNESYNSQMATWSSYFDSSWTYLGNDVSGLILWYDQNEVIGSIFIHPQNGPLDCHYPFYNLASMTYLG